MTVIVCLVPLICLLLITATHATLCVPPVPTLPTRDTPIRLIPGEESPPSSCAGAEVRFGVLRVRVRGGGVVEVLCHQSKEYLVLPQQGADSNFAAVETRITRFCAIRFDPATLLVDIGDLTFAESEGASAVWSDTQKRIDDVPFGIAADCRNSETSLANINLVGTPFAIASSMVWDSLKESSQTTRVELRDSHRQIAHIVAGGAACSAIAPGKVYFSFVTRATETLCDEYQWQLQLQLADPDSSDIALAPCDIPPRGATSMEYTCRDRTLPAPPLCTTPTTPRPAAPARTDQSVHACPPLPPPDNRTIPYPADTVAYSSCIAAGIVNGLALIRVRGGSVVQLFCANQREFLILPKRTGFSNYAQIQTIFTFFCAIRIDPLTLLVDVGDLTFSSTEGQVSAWGSYDRVGYGYAGDCSMTSTGHANIDLRQTPFAIDESARWTVVGYMPVGNADVSNDRQIATIRGSGYCGYIVPSPMATSLTNDCTAYHWTLPLRLNGTTNGPLPACGVPLQSNQTTRCFASRVNPLPQAIGCATPPPTLTLPGPSSSTTKQKTSSATVTSVNPMITTEPDTMVMAATTTNTTATTAISTTSSSSFESDSTNVPGAILANVSQGALIGGIVGGAVGLSLIVAFVVACVVRSKRRGIDVNKKNDAPAANMTKDDEIYGNGPIELQQRSTESHYDLSPVLQRTASDSAPMALGRNLELTKQGREVFNRPRLLFGTWTKPSENSNQIVGVGPRQHVWLACLQLSKRLDPAAAIIACQPIFKCHYTIVVVDLRGIHL